MGEVEERVLVSSSVNFSVVERTINCKKHTIVKYSGELDLEHESVIDFLEGLKKVCELVEVKKRLNS